MSQTLKELQAQLQDIDGVSLTDSQTLYPDHAGSGLPLILVETDACRAVVALNGGQLLSFTPAGGEDLLWLSPNARFDEGTSLRGGIPLCLPWFGPHPHDESKPKHGFARTSTWQLESARALDSGERELTLALHHSTDARFNHDFTARLTVTLGRSLTLALAILNTGSTGFVTSWVMHNYFPVTDLDAARVSGLKGATYVDKVAGGKTVKQSGDLAFAGEVDRVYAASGKVSLKTPDSTIAIRGDNTPSVVTWNPGPELATSIADIGEDNERGFVCVERGACLDHAWRLSPGQKATARMTIERA